MNRQSDVISPRQNILSLPRLLIRQQNDYSVVTSAVPGVLALMLLIDLWFGHPHIDRFRVTLWFVLFAVLTLLPLIAGAKYHLAGGLVLIVALNVWLWSFVSSSNHAHTEVNALLQVPMLALYAGWFYPSWISRTSLVVNLAVVVLAMTSRGWKSDHEFSSANAVVYAAVVSLFCLEIASNLRKRAVEQSRLDPLTGVLNRRGLSEISEKKLRHAHRSGVPITVAVVDFDNFKSMNDSGGHAAGDAALQATARAWVFGLSPDDIVARIGGDEFALIVHGTQAQVAGKMREICEAAPYSWSWGLTEMKPHQTLDELLSLADAAMYKAKTRKHSSQ